jgi:hypothetical protein
VQLATAHGSHAFDVLLTNNPIGHKSHLPVVVLKIYPALELHELLQLVKLKQSKHPKIAQLKH